LTLGSGQFHTVSAVHMSRFLHVYPRTAVDVVENRRRRHDDAALHSRPQGQHDSQPLARTELQIGVCDFKVKIRSNREWIRRWRRRDAYGLTSGPRVIYVMNTDDGRGGDPVQVARVHRHTQPDTVEVSNLE